MQVGTKESVLPHFPSLLMSDDHCSLLSRRIEPRTPHSPTRRPNIPRPEVELRQSTPVRGALPPQRPLQMRCARLTANQPIFRRESEIPRYGEARLIGHRLERLLEVASHETTQRQFRPGATSGDALTGSERNVKPKGYRSGAWTVTSGPPPGCWRKPHGSGATMARISRGSSRRR